MNTLQRAHMGLILETLEDPAAQPYVHPNGFIQLNLSEDRRRRAHFWGHPDIPKQKVATPIHDHTYMFDSRVLKGRLFNIRYHLGNRMGQNTHKIYKWDQEAGALVPTGSTCSPVPNECLCMTPDTGAYKELPQEFHETLVDRPTITFVEQYDYDRHRKEVGEKYAGVKGAVPRILVEIGQEPDNTFDRNAYPHDMLMGIIKEIING